MDVRNGRIYTPEEYEKQRSILMDKEEEECLQDMQVPPTQRQLSRKPPRVGRNDICPCGSGRKFKKCCLVRRIP